MTISSSYTYKKFISRNKNISIIRNGLSENSINSVPGFTYATNDINGPITTNKKSDDGTKSIINSLILQHVDKEEDDDTNKERIAIVMYSNFVKSNSLAEHAISEFYQYANIHNYKFLFYNQRYDKEREPFYMKIHALNEAIVYGLKEREYEWVMWIDNDVILANPNIKLETFLPKNKNIHFIAADRDGLNAGVFFLRVHSWSLNYLVSVLSYFYYNPDKVLKYPEEAALNNILIENKESKHYVIVPHHWFNTYPDKREKGDFLLHFCYRKLSGGDSKKIRNEIRNDPEYISAKTNKNLRKEEIFILYEYN
ncbi:glycosyltransferase family 34 protein [Piromyces sp. E2]|nr:glycosyltransferase family 34 protein [Piromyces sp. E2]|eukprot:OUM67734.1 glycosyltransferase family 34 protein [Piromyces sp. E2]